MNNVNFLLNDKHEQVYEDLNVDFINFLMKSVSEHIVFYSNENEINITGFKFVKDRDSKGNIFMII